MRRRHLVALLVVAAASLLAGIPASETAPARTAASAPFATGARPGSLAPSLSVSPAGELWASWIEKSPGPPAVKVARLEAGRVAMPRIAVAGESLFVNWADTPILHAAAGGRLALAYTWKTGEHAYDLRVVRSSDGGATWSRPLTLHDDRTISEHGFPSLLAESDGVSIVWLDGRKTAAPASGHGHGGEMTLRTAHLSWAGALSRAAELDARVCDCCPTAAVMARGGIVAAYRDRSASEVRDISIVRTSARGWSAPAPLHADGWRIEGCPVNGPALDADGVRVAAAWFTGAEESPRVHACLSRDGGANFGSPVRIDDGHPIGRVDVALRPDGGATVAWLERRAASGGRASLCARTISASGRLSPVVTIARLAASRASGMPRLVRRRDTMIAAWTDSVSIHVAPIRVP